MSVHQAREKFATQLDSALLADLRTLAKAEGRQLQSLVEEAVGKLIESRQAKQSTMSVKEAMQISMNQFGPLYKKLAE